MQKKLLVTSALPYANGSIHLGHLVEFIQTDIFVRFQKHIGNTCVYIGADDTHGTPIMLSAQKQGITPEALIEKTHGEHFHDLTAFGIEFDHYYTTHSEENRVLSEFIYTEAQKKGAISDKEIEQFFCTHCAIFLPDRFIRGTCPHCKAPDQYGDACEKCSSTYSPEELGDPQCSQCQHSPVLKKSQHYFFKLSQFGEQIQTWLNQDTVKPEVKNKLQEWFTQGLREWDISRDAPYFGFKIPGTADKYFYVWMDAPVGYIASTLHWCKQTGADFESIWKSPDYEIHHFIGKDILYFHTLFWPAMLMVSGFNLPTKVNVHGFLTVNGEKMSKSRGTFINAKTYSDHLNPELLRYYFASKLTSSVEDLDFNIDDFVFKVNADVVNKVVNIGSRLGAIVTKKLSGKLTQPDPAGEHLLVQLSKAIPAIHKAYFELEYAHAMRHIMGLADQANVFIDTQAPWNLAKTDPPLAAAVCTTGLNALRLIIGLLKPVCPHLAKGVEGFLNCDTIQWENLTHWLTDHAIMPYEHLAQRVDVTHAKAVLKS